jgi:RHS repeat-associated protein
VATPVALIGRCVGATALDWRSQARALPWISFNTAGDSHLVYDASGNVLLQKDPGATTLYLPGEQITLNTTAQTTTGIRTYPLPGRGTVYRTGSGTSYGFEITDQHATPYLTLDYAAQAPTWRQFTPFGAPRGTTTTWIDNRGYLNKPDDTATGLTIIGARDYDPGTGRFISLDPILDAASPQTLNGYAYTANNPATRWDPSGLCMRTAATDSCNYDPTTGKPTGTGNPDSPHPPRPARHPATAAGKAARLHPGPAGRRGPGQKPDHGVPESGTGP